MRFAKTVLAVLLVAGVSVGFVLHTPQPEPTAIVMPPASAVKTTSATPDQTTLVAAERLWDAAITSSSTLEIEIRALAHGGEKALPELRRLMQAAQPLSVRAAAARVAAAIGTEFAMQMLLAALAEERDEEVRRTLAGALHRGM